MTHPKVVTDIEEAFETIAEMEQSAESVGDLLGDEQEEGVNDADLDS